MGFELRHLKHNIAIILEPTLKTTQLEQIKTAEFFKNSELVFVIF